MGKKPINILHLETEKGWRGGQQQLVYLMEYVHQLKYQTALVCQSDSELAFYCQKKHFPHYTTPIRSEIDIFAGLRISLLCRKKGFTILHSHSGHALSIGIWSKLFYPQLIHVTTRRVDFHIRKHFLSRLKYNTSLVDKIICISEQIRTVLQSDSIPPHKLTMIHSGIDMNRFQNIQPDKNIFEQFGIPPHHTVIGTIASMVGHKDYPNLLQAAKTIIEKRPNVSFCAIGEGPDQDSIRQLAKDLHLGNRFVCIGFQKNVGSFLKGFDIFVLSSRLEGLGTSILDAQAVGLPVVATSTGGIPEIVQHNQNGLLVPPGNPEKLAEALLSLNDNENQRLELGEAGRKGVKQFSIQRTIEEHIALYERLLNK